MDIRGLGIIGVAELVVKIMCRADIEALGARVGASAVHLRASG